MIDSKFLKALGGKTIITFLLIFIGELLLNFVIVILSKRPLPFLVFESINWLYLMSAYLIFNDILNGEKK